MMDLVFANKEPKVWVEKIAIFESKEHGSSIREVELAKGLNLIWAKENAGDEPSLGHGVGKTSFCRLIRYCLGEDSFATREFKERVLFEFPEAYVAAVVWIKGKQWTVARPLDARKKKFVVQEGNFVTVFSDKNQLDWKTYLQAIEQAVVPDQLILPVSGNEVSWGHVLSWCSRDQEAYLGDYYTWRDTRSESDAPGFTHPSKDPINMVRLCLSGESSNEQKLSRKVKQLASEVAILEKEVASLERAPKLAWERLAKLLRNRIGVDQDVPVSTDQPQLFPTDLLGKARGELNNYQDKINKLTGQQDDVRKQQAEEAAERKLAEKNLRRLESLLKRERKDLFKESKERNRRNQIKIKVLAPTDEPCELGNVRLSECQHIQHFQKLIGSDLNERRREHENEKLYQERLSAIRSYRDRVSSAEETIKYHSQKEGQFELSYRKLQLEINTTTALQAQLEQSIDDLSEYDDILSGRSDFKELNDLISELQRKAQEHHRDSQSLDSASLPHAATSKKLTALYKQIVREVFPDYTGECILGASVPFRILGRGGEALHISEVLLGDICTLLYGANKGVTHPGMLIHDSPREADMGNNLYQKYEQLLVQLQQLCLSQSSFPFQYIVTTTTSPSPELLEQKVVKLELHSSDRDGFLFRQSFSGGELL